MSEEIEVIDLAQPAPDEEAAAPSEPPPPPPLVRQESVLAPVPEEEVQKPRRKGRPPGAKNKPKPKPPPEEVQDIEDEPLPPTRRVRMQAPYREAQNLEMAQSILDLMHWQAASKANQRRQLYQSWF